LVDVAGADREAAVEKIDLGAQLALYPSLTVLVGSTVRGEPNFNTIAHVGICDMERISLGMGKVHYSNAGIKENGCFSVNIPSQDLVEKTDFCGLASGRKIDKAGLFEVFYGKLDRAPMIAECPVCLECRLERVVDFPRHDLFVGEIVATYADPAVLTDGRIDFSKVRPLLFDMPSRGYWTLGERIADAWEIGKGLKGRAQ
jgi:flavin reductase (DIM6/NTAB) family NADH-FMN oxidoreductase RutF